MEHPARNNSPLAHLSFSLYLLMRPFLSFARTGILADGARSSISFISSFCDEEVTKKRIGHLLYYEQPTCLVPRGPDVRQRPATGTPTHPRAGDDAMSVANEVAACVELFTEAIDLAAKGYQLQL